jgi:DNA-binding NtrC family response regulator
MMTRKRKRPNLLVADDDYILRRLIGHTFSRAGLSHEVFESGDQLIEAIGEETRACVLDLQMPGRDGMECLRWIRENRPDIEVVILTNVNQAGEAIEAIRAGAFDYITKPFDPDEFVNTVRKAIKMSSQEHENLDLRHTLTEPGMEVDVLGDSEAMERVKKLVRRIGPSENIALLTGESGTGKTLLARTIHACSNRADGPFISVSCPSLPGELLESEMFGHERGAFSGANNRRLGRAELADGGTLFLDEIGDMALSLQPKLLTFIQEKAFYRVGGEELLHSNVRIIAATNQDLEQRVREGTFREDLFFRLNVLPVMMPPLRERKSDIPLLVRHFVKRATAGDGDGVPAIDPGVYTRLSELAWSGNIRELENAVVRACTLREDPKTLAADDFSLLSGSPDTESGSDGSQGFPVGKSLAEIEKLALQQTLALCNNNKAEVARVLGIAEKSVYNKMHKHGLA